MGWLEKYKSGGKMQEHQPNFNEAYVSYPPNFEGTGNNIQGRNYSPSWNGQFEDGGVLSKIEDKIFPPKQGKELLEHRQKVYKTIRPSEYTDVNNPLRYFTNTERKEFDDARSEEAFAKYLGLNKDLKYLSVSPYVPTKNPKLGNQYYQVDPRLEKDIFNSLKDSVNFNQIRKTSEFEINSDFTDSPNLNDEGMVNLVPRDENIIAGRPMVSRARMLGNFIVSKGKDKKGEYLSYSDEYDFPSSLQKAMQGTPYSIYGRVYYPKKENGGKLSVAEDGKQLQLLDQLTNFNERGENKKWLDKYY
jgi:hypothetical protein